MTESTLQQLQEQYNVKKIPTVKTNQAIVDNLQHTVKNDMVDLAYGLPYGLVLRKVINIMYKDPNLTKTQAATLSKALRKPQEYLLMPFNLKENYQKYYNVFLDTYQNNLRRFSVRATDTDRLIPYARNLKASEKYIKNSYSHIFKSKPQQQIQPNVFVDYNVNLTDKVLSVAKKKNNKAQEIIRNAYNQNIHPSEIGNILKEKIDMTAEQARDMALRESSKLHNETMTKQASSMGATHYSWSYGATSARKQNRKSHLAAKNKIFRIGSGVYDKETGQTDMPGEAYGCGCAIGGFYTLEPKIFVNSIY